MADEKVNVFSNIALSADKTNNNAPIDFKDKDVDKDSLDEQIKERYKQDTKYRRHLAKWVMWIVPVWLAFIGLLVCV